MTSSADAPTLSVDRTVGTVALFAVLALPSAAVAALAVGGTRPVAAVACVLPAAALATLLVRRRRRWWVVALVLTAAAVVLGLQVAHSARLSPTTLGGVEQSVGGPAGWTREYGSTTGTTSCLDVCSSATGRWAVRGTEPEVLAEAVSHLRAAGFVDAGRARTSTVDAVLQRGRLVVEVTVQPEDTNGRDDPASDEPRRVRLSYGE